MNNNGLHRLLWRISVPLLFAESVETLDHFVDTLFLARVGLTELGAIGVADSFMLLFLIVPLALVDGIQLLTARRLGEGREEAAGAAFNQGLLAVLSLSLIATVLLKFVSPLFAKALLQSAAVGSAVNGYLQLNAYSLLLTGLTFACSALLTSMGRTRALIPASVIFLIVDVVLNYGFIFGRLGLPEMGMRGAAAGSIGAELLTAAFLVGYICRQLDRRRYGFFRLTRMESAFLRRLTRFALPLSGQSLLDIARWLIFFLIMERTGVSALATANIVFTCFIIFCIPVEGFAEAAFSLTSRALGKGREAQLSRIMGAASKGALLATLPFIAVALIFPVPVVMLFTLERDLVEHAAVALQLLALAMLLVVPAEIWFAGLTATGDTPAALVVEAIAGAVMLAITWLIAVSLAWPPSLAWLALPAAYAACLAASRSWLRWGNWRRLDI